MNGSIGESFHIGPSHTSGFLRIRLRESVRARYRQQGVSHDGYELVIAGTGEPQVKPAGKDGLLVSLWERVRYGFFARYALISNQPAITSLLPSLILLDDDHFPKAARWHLLAYAVEWQVVSSERFYLHYLRERSVITEADLLASIAGDIREEFLYHLRQMGRQSAGSTRFEPLPQAILDDYVIPEINHRIAQRGVRIQRFYASTAQLSRSEEPLAVDEDALVSALINIRHDLTSLKLPGMIPGSGSSPLRAALIDSLLSHLYQPLDPTKEWLEEILRLCGFDLTFAELQTALESAPQPSKPGGEPLLTPASVVQRLKEAGYERLRAANRTAPQEGQLRGQLRRKALTRLELALLLTESARLVGDGSKNNMRFELLALIHSLQGVEQRLRANMTFRPGSILYVIAVATEQFDEETRLVHEILPLSTQFSLNAHEAVMLWTPAVAAALMDFDGAAAEIELTLQVLEADQHPVTETGFSEAALFWRWKVRAHHDHFSVRLRSTTTPTLHEVELQDAEFIDPQPTRSAKFPEVPSFTLRHEPLEIAFLIDGYWLADDGRNGLKVLAKLLDGISVLEDKSNNGLLMHPVICLDAHLSPEFRTVYGSLPSLFGLGDAPIETTAQLIDEALQPWLERWNGWEIKPFPVDTDIALEKGFHYLNQLKWQQTTHPEQRALLAIGRSRPHDHARYFSAITNQRASQQAWEGSEKPSDGLAIPYLPDDRFSVTDIDWREEMRGVRQNIATILAVCDPGLPNPRYQLRAGHLLLREYQEFWATIDQGTRLDVSDEEGTPAAAMGIDRVLYMLESQLFQRRVVRRCQPPLALPFSQSLAAHPDVVGSKR